MKGSKLVNGSKTATSSTTSLKGLRKSDGPKRNIQAMLDSQKQLAGAKSHMDFLPVIKDEELETVG